MIFTIGRHIQILVEKDPEQRKPRARRRYTLACTCNMKRNERGHCAHTLALFEDGIYEKAWKRVEIVEMRAKAS